MAPVVYRISYGGGILMDNLFYGRGSLKDNVFDGHRSLMYNLFNGLCILIQITYFMAAVV